MFRGIGDVAEAEGARIDNLYGRLARTAASIFTIHKGFEFARKIATVRGEYQQLEVAFTTLLQSEEKANRLMAESVELAAKTPFDLQGVANGARQLLAYGFASEEVIDTLRRLGDVAAGLGLPLQRLTYLYGTTAVQGRVYARDMLQFTSSGIPLLQEMANLYGKTTEEINKMVSDGKIGFADVKKVIESMTDAGGQFHNLMEAQSKTINGQISNLQDNISMMMNEIGEANEGIINNAIASAAYLVEHYEAIADILKVLIAAYGTYKATLIAIAAMNRVRAIYAEVSALMAQTAMLRRATQAQILFNTAVKGNPLGLALSAIAAVVTALMAFSDKSEDAARSIGEVEQKLIDEQKQVNLLCGKLTDANTSEGERKRILEELRKIQPSIVDGIYDESGALVNVTANLKAYNDEMARRQVLGQYQDAQNEAQATSNQAHVDKIAAENALRQEVVNIVQNLNNLTGLEQYQYGQYGLLNGYFDMDESAIESFKSKILSVWTDAEKTTEEKAQRIANMLGNTHPSGEFFQSIKADNGAFDGLKTAMENLYQANAAYQQSLQDVSKAQKAVEENTKSLGLAVEESNQAMKDTPTAPVVNDYAEQVRKAAENIETARAAVKAIQDGGDISGYKSLAEALKDKRDAVAAAESAYKELTGETYGQKKTPKVSETAKAEEAAAKAALDAEERLAEARIELERKRITDKIELLEYDKRVTIASIDEQIKAAQSEAERAALESLKEVVANSAKIEIDIETNSRNADRQADLNDMLAIYSNYSQERMNIEQKFNEDISKLRVAATEATTTEERARYTSATEEAERQMRNALASLDVNALKESIDWDSVFGNLSEASTASISRALEQMQTTFDAKKSDMSATEIKDITEAMVQMSDELNKRNPFRGFYNAFGEIKTAKTELIDALKEYESEQLLLLTAQDEYNAALREQSEIESAIKDGSMLAESDELAQAKERVADAADKQAKAEKNVVSAENRVYAANNKVSKAYANFCTRLNTANGVIQTVGRNARNLAEIFSSDVAAKVGQALDFINEVVDATTSVVGVIGDVSHKVVGAVESTVDAASTGMQASAVAAATAISTVEKASVILAVISAALQIATAIANLFNDDDERQEEIERLQRRIDQLQWELDNSDAVILQERSFDVIKKVREVYEQAKKEVFAYYGVTNSFWGRWFVSMIKQNEILAKSVKVLADAYSNLDYTIDKAIGSEKYDNARRDIENLAEQNLLIQKQIEEERSKKHTDYDQIAAWEQQMQENAVQMAEIVSSMVEDIFGGTSVEIAEQLTSAILEAFENGEDAAEAWGEKVKDIVKGIVKNMMLTALVEERIGDVFNTYKKKWFVDGVFQGVDAVQGSLSALASDLNQVGEETIALFESLPDELKDYFIGTVDDGRNAVAKGIATASQDSVDENNARLTTIQGHTYSISQDVKEMRATGEAMLNALVEIEHNTSVTNDILEKFQSRMSNTLDDITTRGIRIR